jgi:hypothetical protein
MFRYPKLIPALILVGCTINTPTSFDICEKPESIEDSLVTNIVAESNYILESVNATLEMADAELQHIEEVNKEKNTYIHALEVKLGDEHSRVDTLIARLDKKDSIITSCLEYRQELETKIVQIEDNLIRVEHKCEEYCFPTIMGLQNQNSALNHKLDSLVAELTFRDSLILSSRKLSKEFQ